MPSGPNGAGKTTFAREVLPALAPDVRFPNADTIAAGLSPSDPSRAALRAGRILLDMTAGAVERRESFAVETTLSGRLYERSVPSWQAAGYRVTLFFLRLSDVETAVERVAERVRQGGHDIPEPVIRRRYQAGLRNLHETYVDLVDDWFVFDADDPSPRLIDRSTPDA